VNQPIPTRARAIGNSVVTK